MIRRAIGIGVIALLIVGVAGGAWWFLNRHNSDFEQALGTLPADTQRATFTDWSYVAERVSGDGQRFFDDAYDKDLSRTSALENTGPQLATLFGIDLRKAEWEVYGQADDGAVAVLKLGDEQSLGAIANRLEGLGFVEPDADDGPWIGGSDLVAGIDPALTPVEYNIAILRDEHLVVLSQDADYATATVRIIRGDRKSLADSVTSMTDQVADPTAAVVWAKDFACESLSMNSADASDQALADQLVEKAGGVSPVSGLLMAADSPEEVTVVMEFADGDQAKRNLQPRTDLASGESPGLGGSFDERFKIEHSMRDGSSVLLHLKAAADEDSLLSSVSQGPVLFATC